MRFQIHIEDIQTTIESDGIDGIKGYLTAINQNTIIDAENIRLNKSINDNPIDDLSFPNRIEYWTGSMQIQAVAPTIEQFFLLIPDNSIAGGVNLRYVTFCIAAGITGATTYMELSRARKATPTTFTQLAIKTGAWVALTAYTVDITAYDAKPGDTLRIRAFCAAGEEMNPCSFQVAYESATLDGK